MAYPPREVATSSSLDGSSLVKVFDTAAPDDLYDDIDDEFGFFSNEPPDTVTVTIKYSSNEEGIVTETKTGDQPIVKPKETKHRQKATGDSLLVSYNDENNVSEIAVNSLVHESHAEPSQPVPPPRNKKHQRTETLAAKDLLGVEMHTAALTWDNTDSSSGQAAPTVNDMATNSAGFVPSISDISKKYSSREKDKARTIITNKIKEKVTPKTNTKIVYDRSALSPVTGTPIEVDRSSVASQDEGEDFVEYLKGLKADNWSSSSEDDDEHILYARSRVNIGGSGENGFHLADIITNSEERNISDDDLKEDEALDDGLSQEHDSELIIIKDNEGSDKSDQSDAGKNFHSKRNDNDDEQSGDYRENDKDDKDSETAEDDDDDDGDDSDVDDDDDDDDNDGDDDFEETDDDTEDDHPEPFIDDQQDNISDGDRSFRDSCSESSDEIDGEENFFAFSPGLRSRCYLLSQNKYGQDDLEPDSPHGKTGLLEYSSVQDICSDILKEILDAVVCTRTSVPNLELVEHGDVNENENLQKDDSCCNSDSVAEKLSDSFLEKGDFYGSKGSVDSTDTQSLQGNETEREKVISEKEDTYGLLSYCNTVDEIANSLSSGNQDMGQFDGTTTEKVGININNTNAHRSMTTLELATTGQGQICDSALKEILQVKEVESLLLDESSSESASEIENTSEFESAVEDDFEELNTDLPLYKDDFWSVSLENVLDSATDVEDSSEFESVCDIDLNNFGIDDAFSDQITDDSRNIAADAHATGLKPDLTSNRTDKKTDCNRNSNDIAGKVKVNVSLHMENATVTSKLTDDNIKSENNDSMLAEKSDEESLNIKYQSKQAVGHKYDKSSSSHHDVNAKPNDLCLDQSTSDVSTNVENESILDSLTECDNSDNTDWTFRNNVLEVKQSETNSACILDETPNKIFDESLDKAFEQVSELIESMEKDYEIGIGKDVSKMTGQNAAVDKTLSATKDHKTLLATGQSQSISVHDRSDISGNVVCEPAEKDLSQEENEHKQLTEFHNVTHGDKVNELQKIKKDKTTAGMKSKGKNDTNKHFEPECRKYRTLTYNVPFIKPEVKKKTLNAEEERQLLMLCRKKMVLLNRNKRAKNAKKSEQKQRGRYEVADQWSYDDNSSRTSEMKQDQQTNTIKVGSGYIILGAGEYLDIPEGPQLKVPGRGEYQCHGKPCRYFRGIPGVINNAYKMSNIFPKAHPPTTAAPQHILHACNRLVTPVPTSTPSPSKERYGMMLEAAAAAEAENCKTPDNADLTEVLHNARDCLNCSKFDDAEAAFLKLYQQIQERPEESGKLLVETLTGLADICIRRSRMCRSNPLEWQWLCMHAIALLQYTMEFCESELEDEQDNKLCDWFHEQKQTSELKCRPLEDAFTRALYNSLKHNANFFDPFQSFSLPNTPVHSSRKTSLFPLSSNMPQYLVIPGMRYRVTDHGLQKQSSDDSNVAVDWLAKFQHYCKDRLQTKDSKECTEKILKSSNKTDDDDDTESVVSHGSNGSLDWDNGDLQGNDSAPQIPGIEEVNEDLLEDDSPVKDYSLAFELASVDSDNEGWDFFLDKRLNCNFQTIVQVSTSDDVRDDKEEEKAETTKEADDVHRHEKPTKLMIKDMISPLHEHSISLTLSRSFCRLADKLVQEEEYKKAEAVYEKILDIIDTIQDGTAGMLKFSARIMKNLGTVKSKLGKSSSGLALLNKALQTYRDLQDEEANFEIAIALIELGNGYIVGKNHEDSVFEDVIIAICDFFEKDSGDPQSTSTSSCGSTSVMTSSLRSDNEERNVEEAVMCYSEAIALLDRYVADEKQTEMFAKAVMRLGDCFFMQNDYDRALDCYERALGMFRSNNIFGRDSLMENAHVLCMLGVSSFMLHVYPRAASVFEMALHLVKCAYGFKRTFLNGMLQSLSGITYYKMKNYHKCVSMCYQSFETYCDIFGEEMSRLNKQKFWLVCQTLYVMGNSYNILCLYQKSIKYLTIARSLMKSSKSRERRQFMRVLQILGDSYFAQYDYKTALTFYNEALEYGECESTVSFDEVFDPNCASDEMAIHNRLVSKSAEAHLNMQQYQNAVHYLEQAHDIQEVMGEDIKEDLINTLNQLGEMHSLAGDIDKAIESYKESLEVFREIHHGELGPDMCTTLGNLAAICYVKACLSDEIEEELEMIRMTEQYFKEALKLDTDDSVCVKYANFLYSQGHYEEAINDLNNALQSEYHMQMSDIVYTGLEKITLPDLLQDEVDTQEEICLPSACLARYLLILCHKALGQNSGAEDNLIGLMEDVIDYDIPLLHSLLGYAMMELSLFEEAAMSFHKAFETEEDYILASENYCICVLIMLLKTLQNAVWNIWEYFQPRQRRCIK